MLLSIQALLSAPNPDDPLANDVAEQWKINEADAIRTGKVDEMSFTKVINLFLTAREWTQLYAKSSS